MCDKMLRELTFLFIMQKCLKKFKHTHRVLIASKIFAAPMEEVEGWKDE
jgi:hypothetical protein